MADQILPEGIRFFNKHEKAPDFVKGVIVITPNDLFTFCKENPQLMTEYDGKKQIRIQLLESKAGKLYGAVDTYKKEEAKAAPAATKQPEDDLPF